MRILLIAMAVCLAIAVYCSLGHLFVGADDVTWGLGAALAYACDLATGGWSFNRPVRVVRTVPAETVVTTP